MVEAEEEYVEQLEVLTTCFIRPFKMAASSKNPPCSHDDINSIFLNSETVLFLHQIFLKGLTARMESWPTLVLGTSLGGKSTNLRDKCFKNPVNSRLNTKLFLSLKDFAILTFVLNLLYPTNAMSYFCFEGDLFDMLLPMLSIYQEYVREAKKRISLH